MQRILIYVLSVFFVGTANGQTLDLSEIRRDFNKGVRDKALCEGHLAALEKYARTPVEKGYEAAFHMFMAKHTNNPFKKMSYFSGGKKMLEKQISADPDNVELRFIRLCIQYHTPSYLGYRDHISEDKAFLLNNLYKLGDEQTKEVLFNHLKKAKNMYTEEELTRLGR